MESRRSEDGDGDELVDLPIQRLPDEEAQIGGSRDSNIQAGGQIDDDSDDSQDGMSPDEKARLWADLEAETGFSSYKEYLKAYEGRHPDLKKLLDTIPDWPFVGSPFPHSCAIYDIEDRDCACPTITLQCSTSSAERILLALRRPSAIATARIVLWQPGPRGKMVDALGLGLRIQPRFFQAYYDRHAHARRPERFKEDPLTPELIVIGRYVVTIARHYLPAIPDATPVILIAELDAESLGNEEEIVETLPFQKPVTNEPYKPINRLPSWMRQYDRILKSDLENERKATTTIRDLIFRSLTPLLHFQIWHIRKQSGSIRKEYSNMSLTAQHGKQKEDRLENLFRMRSLLRRLIEHSEEQIDHLLSIVYSRMTNDTQQRSSSTVVEDDFHQALRDARRWETEIRDYLQLQTGESALQESRKSIELSNFQIEEAKRG